MRRTASFLLLFFFVPWLARAEETWTGTSDVKFRGYSTLHNFDGTLKQVPLKKAGTK